MFACAAVSALLLCAVQVKEVPPASLSIKEIVQGLEDAEKAIKNLSVSYQYDKTQYPVVGPGQPQRSKATVTYVVDATGRLKIEGHTTEGPGEGGTDSAKVVYDGQEAKILRIHHGKPLSGLIRPNTTGVPLWVDPWELATHYEGSPVSKLLGDGGRVSGFEKAGPDTLVVIEAQYHVNDQGQALKTKFWINLAEGFSVSKKMSLMKPKGARDWVGYHIIEGYHYEEVSPGIWLPSESIKEFYLTDSPQGRRPFVKYRLTHLKWEVNLNFPNSLFQLKYPVGLFVNDQVRGISYITGKVSNQLVKEQVQDAVSLNQGGSSKIWIFWTFNGFIAALLLLYVFVRVLARRKAG